MPDTLRINEIFYSIQGESTRAGHPCVFIRLAGCHLRCRYCDTEYAFHEGATREIEDIIREATSHPCKLVEVTGGEPLLQPRAFDLMNRLAAMGMTVLVETSGACDISGADRGKTLDTRVVRIMDLKTPGSGEVERNDWTNIDRLRKNDEVKFVICDRADYEWARDVIGRYDLADRVKAVLLSAVFEQPTGLEIVGQRGLPMRTLAEWILADGLPVVMQTQLHKFIWEPQTRGV